MRLLSANRRPRLQSIPGPFKHPVWIPTCGSDRHMFFRVVLISLTPLHYCIQHPAKELGIIVIIHATNPGQCALAVRFRQISKDTPFQWHGHTPCHTLIFLSSLSPPLIRPPARSVDYFDSCVYFHSRSRILLYHSHRTRVQRTPFERPAQAS